MRWRERDYLDRFGLIVGLATAAAIISLAAATSCNGDDPAIPPAVYPPRTQPPSSGEGVMP